MRMLNMSTEHYRIRVHNERLWHYPKTVAHLNTSAQHWTYSKHIQIIPFAHPPCNLYNVDMPTINVSFGINDAMAVVYWLELRTNFKMAMWLNPPKFIQIFDELPQVFGMNDTYFKWNSTCSIVFTYRI